MLKAIKQLRVGKIFEEYELQKDIANTFDNSGIIYIKECRLGSGNRVDFLTQSGVAVEVKKGKPNRTQLINQINRYAEYPEVEAVVIVVVTSLRIPITKTANGKPCSVIGLQKQWGIAL